MCTAAAVGGFMALSSVFTQSMAIQAQNQMLTEQAQIKAQYAVDKARADYSQLELRRQQENTRITVEQYRQMRQGLRTNAKSSVRLADAGVYGGSTLRDVVANSIETQLNEGTLENNLNMTEAEISNKELSVYNQSQSLRNEAQSSLNKRTGQTATVLGLIGTGLSAYSSGSLTGMKIFGH